MRNLIKALVIVATAMSLVIGSATHASAEEVGVVVFTGKATVNPGINIPPLPPAGATPGTWTFTSGNPNNPVDPLPCIAIAVSTKKGTPPVPDVRLAQPCNITATGILDGILPGVPPLNVPYCGLTQGRNGTGNFAFGPQRYTLNNVGWTASAGSLLVVRGSITKTATNTQGPGQFLALVNALPDPNKYTVPDLACVTTPGDDFIVAGVAAYVI